MEPTNQTNNQAQANTPNTGAPRTASAPRGNFRGGPRSSGGPGGSRGPGGNRAGAGGGHGGKRPGSARPERVKPEFEQKTLSIRRVTRVVSGGRRFTFSVALAIGDKKGSMGLGLGKAGDTTLAMQKAYNDARKNMIKLRLNDHGTIEHDVDAKYKSARVMLMPNTGRGVVVGSAMRVMVELAGMKDITGRVISGSKNKLNIAQATMKALSKFALPKRPKVSSPDLAVKE